MKKIIEKIKAQRDLIKNKKPILLKESVDHIIKKVGEIENFRINQVYSIYFDFSSVLPSNSCHEIEKDIFQKIAETLGEEYIESFEVSFPPYRILLGESPAYHNVIFKISFK